MHKKNNAQQASLQPLLVFVVLMMMVLMQMTADQYVPSLPAIAKAFNSTETSTQLTLSLFIDMLLNTLLIKSGYVVDI